MKTEEGEFEEKLEKKKDHDLYAIELGNSGIRKAWIPGEHLERIPARIETTVIKPRNTSWMVDKENQIIAEHNVGDVVAITFKKKKRTEAVRLNFRSK